MTLHIHWDSLEANHLERKNEKLASTNLLQSIGYCVTQCRINKQTCRVGKITINNEYAGQVFILEATILKGAIHALIMDRGPIWCAGYDTIENKNAFFTEFAKHFPRRFGRMRRIIPEVEDTPQVRAMFAAQGYKRKTNPGYETLLLNLTADAETLRKNIRKNWNASLKKAESHGGDLVVEWDTSCLLLPWFLENYRTDRILKKYNGPSTRLLNEFVTSFGIMGDMLIGRALYKGEAVAGVLILCHGDSATYQVGWNHNKGRDVQAHHKLLWDAIRVLKERDITEFDLGGINEQGAAGVKTFKTGLAGKKAKHIQLAGFYT